MAAVLGQDWTEFGLHERTLEGKFAECCILCSYWVISLNKLVVRWKYISRLNNAV